MKNLTKDDIDGSIKNELSVQDYSQKLTIEGVKIVNLKRFSGEDGTFEDLLRIDQKGAFELFPEIMIRQINRSKLLPGCIKAWHLHFKQEDIWYIPPEDHMILGLWDVREGSTTKDMTMKVVMGNGVSKVVLIPRGVAHGVVNLGKKSGEIFYFMNNQYDISDPDEQRLPWDRKGAAFWEVEKG